MPHATGFQDWVSYSSAVIVFACEELGKRKAALGYIGTI